MKVKMAKKLMRSVSFLILSLFFVGPLIAKQNNLIFPLTNYPEEKNLSQEFSAYLGLYRGKDYNGYHGAEDIGAPVGTPVKSIAPGTVKKIFNLAGNLGALIAILHEEGPFVIPERKATEAGKSYQYPTEKVDKMYSVYVHIVKESNVSEGSRVEKGQRIGKVADIKPLAPHLHFEIRHSNQKSSASWVFVGDKSNWSTFTPGGEDYTGYYKYPQKMVDAGLRHPSDFIKINSVVSPVWNEYKVSSLYVSVPADWVFIMPQKNGLVAVSVMDSKNKKHLNLAVGIEEMSGFFKDAETGKWRIIHYGFEGGKKIEESGTTSQTMSVGHVGNLVDSFKTKLSGRSVTVCVLRGGGQGITQEGVKKVEHTILSLAFFEKGKHCSIILWGIDLTYQKEIFEKLISKIRFAS